MVYDFSDELFQKNLEIINLDLSDKDQFILENLNLSGNHTVDLANIDYHTRDIILTNLLYEESNTATFSKKGATIINTLIESILDVLTKIDGYIHNIELASIYKEPDTCDDIHIDCGTPRQVGERIFFDGIRFLTTLKGDGTIYYNLSAQYDKVYEEIMKSYGCDYATYYLRHVCVQSDFSKNNVYVNAGQGSWHFTSTSKSLNYLIPHSAPPSEYRLRLVITKVSEKISSKILEKN